MKRYARYVAFVPLLAILAVLYSGVIKNDPFVVEDDDRVVLPLKNVSSFGEYARQVRSAQVLDVQPVRDLSYLIDFKIQNVTGVKTFHLTNFFIFLGLLALFYFLLLRIGVNPDFAPGAVTLFALHPVFVDSVAWISARKHLLASFFVLAATNLLAVSVNKKRIWRYWAWITIVFILALFSQPIALLWPVWALIFILVYVPKGERKRYSGILLTTSLLSCAAAFMNFKYYTGLFVTQNAGHLKVTTPLDPGIFLAVGRYFFQIIFPYKLGVYFYQRHETANIIGLLLFIPFVAFFAIKDWKRTAVWLGFFFAPLAVVSAQLTNVFVSDTYMILPLAALTCLIAVPLGDWIARAGTKTKTAANVCLAIVAILFTVKSFAQITAWNTTKDFCRKTFEDSPAPQNMTCHGMYLLNDGKAGEALAIAARIHDLDPDYRGAADLTARAVVAENWPLEEKIRFLRLNYLPSTRFSYYLALLLGQAGRFDEAYDEFTKPMTNVDKYVTDMRGLLENAMAEFLFICSKAGRHDCISTMNAVRSSRIFVPWDDNVFQKRLNELGIRLESPR